MAVDDALCVSWLSYTTTNTTFLSKATDDFSHSSAEVRGKKIRLNRESNSQPPGHESDTLTTEPPLPDLYNPKVL